MRTLGISGGWMFFEHAGAAVAVDLKTDDVTDVFEISELGGQESGWNGITGSAEEQRATLLARSALAVDVDPLQTFAVPDTVRASARQALQWQRMYGRAAPLPVVASAVSLVPPRPVQETARHALASDLGAAARVRAEQLGSGRAVPMRLVQQMHLYFSRHQQAQVSTDDWLSWGGDAGRVWAARTVESRGDRAQSVIEKLADVESVDYDTLRLLPRAFSLVASPHTPDCHGVGECTCGGSKESALYPSERALTFLGLGGDFGREWARRTLRRVEGQALTATGYDADANVAADEEVPDSESFDGTVPHVFTPVTENPDFCLFCGKDEQNELHADDAVDYSNADTPPDSAHYFSETLNGEDACEICGKAVDDTLHKQAALAAYYLYKDDIDKKVAETRQYWEGRGEPENAEAVTAAIDQFGEWVELPPESVVVAVDSDLLNSADGLVDDIQEGREDMAAGLFWYRHGNEDDDPLAYYASHTGDDQMLVDQLYVTDGTMFYLFNPREHRWTSTRLDSTEQVIELDDQSAFETMAAMLAYPDRAVDLRELNPAEALLMAESVAALDDEMLRRTVVTSAGVTAFNDGYTPEERSQNARKQVRDAQGRFAKSGSRVVDSGGRAGTVSKIDPDSQQVQIAYDDGGEPAWVPAKQVSVTEEEPPAEQPVIDVSKVAGKPRATGRTPKALLKAMLPPMDRDAINAVIENYPAFIEKERAGAKARAEAQKALDEKSRKQWEDQQERLEADYRRRLEKIHAKGKSARDAIDRIYRKILPGYKRRPVLAAAIADPSQSDVAPVYMAEVDEANQNAVLELLAIVPASTEGTEPQILRYTATGWVPDPKILRALKSTSPPAVVSLDEAQFNDTLEQVKHFYTTPQGKAEAEIEAKEAKSVAASLVRAYGEYGELIAAGVPGIADTPSDAVAVERLKRYWTVGEGGIKIGWNTPGDMTRCMRHLRKYMPRKDMHAGYCAKLHHLMTGTWPGDRGNVGRRGDGHRGNLFTTTVLTSDQVIDFSAMMAGAQCLLAAVEAPERADQVPREMSGAPFVIPILAPVGVKSGDGRKFAPLSLSIRDLPLPLLWQIQTQDGHDASVIVGRIDSIQRAEDGSLVNARGVFDVGPYGQEAERLVRHKFLRGVSVDLDNFEAEARPRDLIDVKPGHEGEHDNDDVVKIVADEMTVTNGRVMGATLVAKPAFQQCTIQIEEEPEEEAMVADGTYIGTPHTEAETEEMVRSALTAAGIPLHPPAAWFQDPQLTTETPLTVTDDGRVFGHVATWDTEHIGLPFSTRPPRSRSNYAYFHTGVLRTAEGGDVPVGQLTLVGGHAGLDKDAAMAVKHYDDTASAMADIRCGEDAYGIWAAGALRPSVTGEQIRVLRASPPSGDWRPIHGRLEMVAVLSVNVPGFPVTRARVASGHVMALVAAGTATLNRLREAAEQSPMDSLIERIETLEAPQREALDQAREAALARVNPVREEKAAAVRERFASMNADIEEAVFKDYSKDTREKYAREGKAMKGGRYPIANVGDLKRAIHAYGRGNPSDKPAIRRHIKKRARALGKTDLIPESWNSTVSLGEEFATFAHESPDETVFRDIGTDKRKEMAKKGQALPDGSYPIATVGDLKNAIRAYGRAKESDKAKVRRHIKKRARALGKTDLIPESWASLTTPVQDVAGEIMDLAERMTLVSGGATVPILLKAPPEVFDNIELVAAGGRYPDGTPWNPSNHPRDEKGRFRQVIAELREDLEEEAGTEQAVEGLAEVERQANQGDMEAAQQAAQGVLDLVDQIAKNTKDAGAVETLRDGYTNLAEAVANLPLVFGDLNEKYRFSDLPADLQELIKDLYSRAEKRLEPDHLTEAGGKIKEFMAGGDVLSQPQISAELSRILRFLI